MDFRKFNISEIGKNNTVDVFETKQHFINIMSMRNLESIAVLNVAIMLCQQSDIKNTILQESLKNRFDQCKLYCYQSNTSFIELEKSIFHKLSLVPLPKLLKAEVANYISPVLQQMLEWLNIECKNVESMDSLCWTNAGTIDKLKTTKQLIQKDSIQDINSVFKLACRYCVEDSIPNLWNKLPREAQEYYLYSKTFYSEYGNHLVAYWTSVVNNDISRLFLKIKPSDCYNIYNCADSVNKNMFVLAMSEGNIFAVKYFWNKLTDEEIVRNNIQWINDSIDKRKGSVRGPQNINNCSNVLYFLLSQIDDAKQQSEIIKKNGDVFLSSLIFDWPWQRYPFPIIQTIWFLLDKEKYVKLLFTVAGEYERGTEELFRELWQVSPIEYKDHFIQYVFNRPCGYVNAFLLRLLAQKDERAVKLILNCVPVEEYPHIILSIIRRDRCLRGIYIDNLSLFDTLISKIFSYKFCNHIIKARIIQQHGSRLCCDWICNNNWEMIEKFMNWAFTSQDEIDNFKHTLDKVAISHRILRSESNYELIDKFLSWCFRNDQEINQFKKNFAASKCEIVTVGSKNWYEFETFLDWCFISDADINEFKLNVQQCSKLSSIIFLSIVHDFNFEFVDKLIHWCCRSTAEIKQFKEAFVLSDTWMNIFKQLIYIAPLPKVERYKFDVIQNFFSLFFPLEKDVIISMKRRISAYVSSRAYQNLCPLVEEDFFRIINFLIHEQHNENNFDSV